MFRIRMLPAGDGDCILVETGSPASPHRILIDGGRKAALPAIMAEIGRWPARAGPPIDLAVLTHVDADHVEGLLAYAEAPGSPALGGLWLNGLDHVRIAAGKAPMPPWPPPAPRPARVATLSLGQAARLGRTLRARGWPWNAELRGGPVMADEGLPLPAVPLPQGGRIVMLGPPRPKLAATLPSWEAAFKAMSRDAQKTLKVRTDRPVPTVENLPLLAASRNVADDTAPNGASIVVVVEHGGKRALFAADAHPGDLAAALDRYEPGGGQVRFDAIKVPHHGSAANNTSALIDRLDSPNWLISTDGSRHAHPDPEAVARIILGAHATRTLVFNYRSDANGVWDSPELAGHFEYRARYHTGIEPVCLA